MANEQMTKERAAKIVSELDSRTSDEHRSVLAALVEASSLPNEEKKEEEKK